MTDPPNLQIMLDQISNLLARLTFRYRDERELQAGIHCALEGAGYSPEREVVLAPGDRIDLLLRSEKVGIEVKVGGNAETLFRQCERYARSTSVDGLIVLTNRAKHAGYIAEMPHIGQKPFRVVRTKWL